MRDGTLEAHLSKMERLERRSAALYRARARHDTQAQSSDQAAPSRTELTLRYVPSLFRAAA